MIETKWVPIHDLHTFQVANGELYCGGKDEWGNDICLVFPVIEFLEHFAPHMDYILEKCKEHLDFQVSQGYSKCDTIEKKRKSRKSTKKTTKSNN